MTVRRGRTSGRSASLIGTALLFLAGGGAAARSLDVAVGKALFDRIWTIAGASNQASDGLGPLFNARSCAACHPGGGAGRLPGEDGGAGLVLRLPSHSPLGQQLQTEAVPGLRPEGELVLGWRFEMRRLADGTQVQLRAPEWHVADPAIGDLPATGSLRLAPDLAGLGSVEAVLAGTIDRPFGLKGSHADLRSQVAEALRLDLGLSTHERPEASGDCTSGQLECLGAPQGAQAPAAELSDGVLDALVSYVRAIPPPKPLASADPAGEELFAATGCAGCHRPRLGTLAVYSDLRVHDLGEGLADRDLAGPDRARWRTAPLWGLGMKLRNNSPLLHDGRARDALEAILWHGGEAGMATARFVDLPAAERDRLIDFLKGL